MYNIDHTGADLQQSIMSVEYEHFAPFLRMEKSSEAVSATVMSDLKLELGTEASGSTPARARSDSSGCNLHLEHQSPLKVFEYPPVRTLSARALVAGSSLPFLFPFFTRHFPSAHIFSL